MYTEIFYVFARSDGRVIKGDGGTFRDSFDKLSATNKDTLSFIFIYKKTVFIKVCPCRREGSLCCCQEVR